MAQTTGGGDAFEGLDWGAVDWAALTHAYGGAEAVPFLVRTLMSEDPDERAEALEALFGSLFHQGTVFPASAPAIPFLARAALAAPGDRAQVALLMAGMSRAYGEDWTDPATFSGAVRAQLAAVVGELAPLLADPDVEVRRAMLRILAVCPSDRVQTLVDLRESADESDLVRADALMALARVEGDWPGLRARLARALADGSPAVRQAAAVTLMELDGLPYPDEIVAVLAESVAAVGETSAWPDDASWDGLSGTTGAHSSGVQAMLVLDPDAALAAASRMVSAGTRYAVEGAYLADAVARRWRGK